MIPIACIKPLIAWELEEKTKNGRKTIVWKDPYREGYKGYAHKIEIPCGQCTECRLAYARSWALRLMLEKKFNNYAYFITLTYDDDHIHNVNYLDKVTGEIKEQSTLLKKDMTDFLKRYRKKTTTHDFGKVRYYYCGEYGDQTMRSHFHIIIYQENKIPDLNPLFINREHQQIWTSKIVESIWGNGLCSIGEVTLESRGYVARYVMKKQTGDRAEAYHDLGIEAPFVQMSLKPGIGTQYYDKSIYDYDRILMPNMNGKTQKLKPPRKFDETLFLEDPTMFKQVKDKRRINAIIRREQKESLTTSETWREDEIESKLARQKLLRRADV